MHIAQEFAEQWMFMISFCRISQADESTAMFDKAAQGLFLLEIEWANVPVEYNNLICSQL